MKEREGAGEEPGKVPLQEKVELRQVRLQLQLTVVCSPCLGL